MLCFLTVPETNASFEGESLFVETSRSAEGVTETSHFATPICAVPLAFVTYLAKVLPRKQQLRRSPYFLFSILHFGQVWHQAVSALFVKRKSPSLFFGLFRRVGRFADHRFEAGDLLVLFAELFALRRLRPLVPERDTGDIVNEISDDGDAHEH